MVFEGLFKKLFLEEAPYYDPIHQYTANSKGLYIHGIGRTEQVISSENSKGVGEFFSINQSGELTNIFRDYHNNLFGVSVNEEHGRFSLIENKGKPIILNAVGDFKELLKNNNEFLRMCIDDYIVMMKEEYEKYPELESIRKSFYNISKFYQVDLINTYSRSKHKN